MTKKITILFLLTALLFSACNKKKLPSEASQDPVFYFAGELDGEAIKFEAGNDKYIMQANYHWDTTNVCLFTCDLKKQACDSTCHAYAIRVIFNDYTVTAPGSKVNLDNTISVGEYAFNDRDLPSMYYQVGFTPKVVKSASEIYNWTFENGTESPLISSKYCPWLTITAGLTYSVTLNFDNNNGCSSIHQNLYRVGHSLQANIAANRNASAPGAAYDFSCQLTGTGPYKYLWDFGDGTSSISPNPYHSYQVMLNGRSRVALRVIDAKNDTCMSYYQVQISADPSCDANFTSTFTPIPNTKAFKTITVVLTDNEGNVYSSKLVAQPESSKFEITSISDYLENTDKHPTKRIKAKFDCVLSNGSKQVHLTNTEVSLAIAYSY
jgi:hypothetical protein